MSESAVQSAAPDLTCRVADLLEDRPVVRRVGNEEVMIVRHDGEVFALSNLCSHAEVSLADGEVAGGHVECFLHGSRFDLRTGEPDAPPAVEPVATYRTETHHGDDPYVAVYLS